MASPSSAAICATSRGEPSKARKSFSKISIPSKPAAAMAASFSRKSPLIETVAIDVFIASPENPLQPILPGALRNGKYRSDVPRNMRLRAGPVYLSGTAMSELTLRQVEVIRAVMLAGTIQGAARLLNVSAPGISRLVRHTEDLLDIRLFERKAGLFVPSPEATPIFEMVHQVHRQMDNLNTAVASLRK